LGAGIIRQTLANQASTVKINGFSGEHHMINSMTAFAREADDSGAGSLVVEIRSVNHRYLDCTFKLPEPLRALESNWRQLLQKALSRGKLDCFVRWQPAPNTDTALEINRDRLQQLAQASATVADCFADCQAPTAIDVLQWPGILEAAGDDTDELPNRATALFKQALKTLQESRHREGEKLAGFIGDRIKLVLVEVERTRQLMPELVAQQRVRLERRLADINTELDPQRLEQELVILAQKTDVEEELDRLHAHVEEVERVLTKGGPCGRRLDFLMQELNREANTLSSKSTASSTTQNAVELKVLIEQMREQIQNLE
jgi:uncharacterized protein (TIGR00255 family)